MHQNHPYPSTKTILYLHPHFTLPGGAGRHALETARVLANRGWRIHIAAIDYRDELIKPYTPAITFHKLGGPLSNSIWYWPHLPLLFKRVLATIDSIKPDIVFSQVFPANWWGFCVKALRGGSLKHLWMCQEPSAFIHSKRWLDALPYSAAGILARVLNHPLRFIDTRLARHVDLTFANSRFSRELAFKAYGYSEELVDICYPGVDTLRFTPDSSVTRDRYRFVTCARLTKFKNIDKILQAVKIISEPEVGLTVIGKGEEYHNLKRLSNELGLDERIEFLETVSDLEMIHKLRSSYALIHAASEEPFGLTPVEAMACGTPVIAMRDGGPAETVIDGETGYLAGQASADEIALGMRWLIERRGDMDKISLACVARAAAFTWELASDSLERGFARVFAV